MLTGGDLIADVLVSHGVRTLFTLCGGHISPILVSSRQRDIRIVDTRHEAAAVFAADAEARLSGRPGVAAVTAGPGITNTITALKNAQLAASPLVVFCGATATILKGRGSLQDIDQEALLLPHVKWFASARRVKDLAPLVREAFTRAQEGVPGPTAIECPVDLLYAEEVGTAALRGGQRPAQVARGPPAGALSAVARAAAVLWRDQHRARRRGRRPVPAPLQPRRVGGRRPRQTPRTVAAARAARWQPGPRRAHRGRSSGRGRDGHRHADVPVRHGAWLARRQPRTATTASAEAGPARGRPRLACRGPVRLSPRLRAAHQREGHRRLVESQRGRPAQEPATHPGDPGRSRPRAADPGRTRLLRVHPPHHDTMVGMAVHAGRTGRRAGARD